jgi:hypothetical protein
MESQPVSTRMPDAVPTSPKEDQAMAATHDNPGSLPRERLSREQDLAAELFRMRDRLRLAELDAEAFHSRSLELERQVGDLEVRLAADSLVVGQTREQLGSALGEIAEQRQHFLAEVQMLRRQLAEEARLRDCYRQAAESNARELTRVLSSKSWALLRPLRRVVLMLRGRPFSEPQAVSLDRMPETDGDSRT